MVAYTGPRNQLPSCMNKENIFSVTRPVILYFWGKVKRQGCKFISPQLSINISHWRFYFISNWKSSMLLYWINLIKWIVMKQRIIFKGKDTFLFIFNVLPQIPIYAVFPPVHIILFSSDISFEDSYIRKGILENLAWKICWRSHIDST